MKLSINYADVVVAVDNAFGEPVTLVLLDTIPVVVVVVAAAAAAAAANVDDNVIPQRCVVADSFDVAVVVVVDGVNDDCDVY